MRVPATIHSRRVRLRHSINNASSASISMPATLMRALMFLLSPTLKSSPNHLYRLWPQRQNPMPGQSMKTTAPGRPVRLISSFEVPCKYSIVKDYSADNGTCFTKTIIGLWVVPQVIHTIFPIIYYNYRGQNIIEAKINRINPRRCVVTLFSK
jgi:hypothetical protein